MSMSYCEFIQRTVDNQRLKNLEQKAAFCHSMLDQNWSSLNTGEEELGEGGESNINLLDHSLQKDLNV